MGFGGMRANRDWNPKKLRACSNFEKVKNF